MDTLLLEVSPGELRAALLAAGQVWQVEHERAGDAKEPGLGAVICGRVARLDPGMNAAFVDIGEGVTGFLRARDALDGVGSRDRGGRIQRLVQEGALVPVQIIGSARGDKGPTVSMAVLRDDWADLSRRCQGLAGPVVVAPGPGLVSRLLTQYGGPDLVRVVTNDLGVAKAVEAADISAEVAVETPDTGLFEAYGVEAALAAALVRQVAVPGGGRLTFDETEALSVVDLDSGSHVGRAGRGARDVNLQAVPEIARQLRLRNIGGVVVIDILKLQRADDRRDILEALREALANDPAGVSVHGLTGLGLVELTRSRRGMTLASRLLEPVGEALRQPDAVAYDALRQLVRTVAAEPRAGTKVQVCPAVAAVLRGPLAPALSGAEAYCGTRVVLMAKDDWPRERVVIEGDRQ
ncbi:MAG: ribonuclease E/G [Alphaproteobacteria bacterium]